MALGKETLERQLANARADLASCEKSLDENGVAADQRKRNSLWRNLESKCRDIVKRVNTVKAIEERDAECVRRKAEATAD
jgi:hypothetical protein